MFNNKTVSIFLNTKPDAPIIYLNTFSDEGQKVYEATQAIGCPPFTLVAISDLDWNHDMVPWTVRLLSKMLSLAPAARTTICGFWLKRSFPRQRRKLPEFLIGVGSPGIPWPDCLPCMPSTRQIYFPV